MFPRARRARSPAVGELEIDDARAMALGEREHIGRLAVGAGEHKRLTIEELEVTRLKVTELEVAGEKRPSL